MNERSYQSILKRSAMICGGKYMKARHDYTFNSPWSLAYR